MLPALVITLREGLEAALIVVIVAAYLKRTGRLKLLPRIWIGVAGAVVVSIILGLAIAAGTARMSFKAQEAFEGGATLVAVGVLTWMIFWMRHHARSIKGELETKIDSALSSGHKLALPLVAFTAVIREGIETVIFLNAALTSSSDPAASGGGAVVGLLIAVAISYAMYQGGLKVNLRRFFLVTGGLIVIVSAGLLARSLHEFNEAGVLVFLNTRAWDVSDVIGPSTILGSTLGGLFGYEARPTYLQVIVYWAYLLPTLFAFFVWPRIEGARMKSLRAVQEKN